MTGEENKGDYKREVEELVAALFGKLEAEAGQPQQEQAGEQAGSVIDGLPEGLRRIIRLVGRSQLMALVDAAVEASGEEEHEADMLLSSLAMSLFMQKLSILLSGMGLRGDATAELLTQLIKLDGSLMRQAFAVLVFIGVQIGRDTARWEAARDDMADQLGDDLPDIFR